MRVRITSKRDAVRLICLRRRLKPGSDVEQESNAVAPLPGQKLSLDRTSLVKKLFLVETGNPDVNGPSNEKAAVGEDVDVELEDGEDESLAKAVERETAMFLCKLTGSSKHEFWEQQKYAQGLIKLRGGGSRHKEEGGQPAKKHPRREPARAIPLTTVVSEAAPLAAKTVKPRGGIFTEDPDVWAD